MVPGGGESIRGERETDARQGPRREMAGGSTKMAREKHCVLKLRTAHCTSDMSNVELKHIKVAARQRGKTVKVWNSANY